MNETRKVNIVPRQKLFAEIQKKEKEIIKLSCVLLQKSYSKRDNKEERHILGCQLYKLREEVFALKIQLAKECEN
jgi:hypothetical protein